MADHKELDRLSKELEASLQRIDKLQKGHVGVPLGRRLYRIVASPWLAGAAAVGCMFMISLDRLEEKRENQAWHL